MSHESLRTVRTGRWAETFCVLVLRQKGYQILLRDFRTSVGEVDIVARRGRTLLVIEVKAQAIMTDAASAVGERQRQRITRAAAYLMTTLPEAQNANLRFDAMLVVSWRLPTRIMNAWGH